MNISLDVSNIAFRILNKSDSLRSFLCKLILLLSELVHNSGCKLNVELEGQISLRKVTYHCLKLISRFASGFLYLGLAHDRSDR
jgi:hypothetical protein